MRHISCICTMLVLFVVALTGQNLTTDLTKLQRQVEDGAVSAAIAKMFHLCCENRQLESKLTYVELIKKERYAVLEAYDTMCDKRTLMIFHGAKQGWEYVQTISIPTLTGVQPLVSFPDLLSDGDHEIVVAGALVDHGTGIEQKNLTIFKLVSDRVDTVFDAPESVHIQEPSKNGVYSFEQRSVFKLGPSSESNHKNHAFSETQTLVQGSRRVVRYRACSWDSDVHRFRCYEQAP